MLAWPLRLAFCGAFWFLEALFPARLLFLSPLFTPFDLVM